MAVIVNKTERKVTVKIQRAANGKDAYELAVDNGFTGTRQEWFDSLKMTFSQLTASEKAELTLKFSDLTPGQKEDIRGEQGEPFTYEDFTEEQLEALRTARW